MDLAKSSDNKESQFDYGEITLNSKIKTSNNDLGNRITKSWLIYSTLICIIYLFTEGKINENEKSFDGKI